MVNSLFANAYSLYISGANMNLITLPWDLFKLSFNLDNDIIADKFLEFISNIKIKNGYYFNQHYMHDKLWVWYILINSNLFDKLLPYIEDLKQIKSIKDDDRKSWQIRNIGSTILDKFLFKNIDSFRQSNHFVLTENLEKYFFRSK